ncbi:MAG: sigma-70 family RNA polymerase sigma factor [Desulfobulbaceae bacterium]|nr:sigma-70 family RNA polymerase sigma factor [Desulfobulbaceae bacterium]
MSNESTDKELVKRVQKGEKGAFDLLVLKYEHKIVNLVMRYVRDPEMALDITQEAFIKAYRALPRFRGDSAFYTWLYRIAVNTAKNYLAAQRRRPMDIELDLQDPPLPVPPASPPHATQREKITHAAPSRRCIAEFLA